MGRSRMVGMEADNMEVVVMFQITSINKSQTMLWAEATATRAAARTRGEAPAMVNLLTALPSTGSSISSINNSINSGSSGSSNSTTSSTLLQTQQPLREQGAGTRTLP